ncbi:MAG: GNAT family N-acetyltransferase [bacterium]|nr:GNAT family N-acetyltransferase [bacterium]
MPDMLVKLYQLPPLEEVLEGQRAQGIEVRRAIAPEKSLVVEWVRHHFKDRWADEVECAFGHSPVGCFIAVQDGILIGFGCHDATVKNYFGPTGVDPVARGQGTGRALLLACLHAMKWEGYAYAVIGGVGPWEFYAKACGATIIDDSSPGIYGGMLRG